MKKKKMNWLSFTTEYKRGLILEIKRFSVKAAIVTFRNFVMHSVEEQP